MQSSKNRLVRSACALLALAVTSPAMAALAVGDPAADFTVPAVQGRTETTVDLAALRRKGPVVLFFLPSVFSGGSDAECRQFADAIDRFRASGASVIGMSRDPIDALSRFSVEDCGASLPLASADPAIVNGFDVNDSANFATRTTYVIGTDGRIAFVDDDDDYASHVMAALAFVQSLKR